VREFPGVVVVDESRPGLSYARNRGISAATGDVIVTTDDDVTCPDDWIERLVAPFQRDDVMIVTGERAAGRTGNERAAGVRVLARRRSGDKSIATQRGTRRIS
jgi:glycosyltransferase involved in cell wall biosynthesis